MCVFKHGHRLAKTNILARPAIFDIYLSEERVSTAIWQELDGETHKLRFQISIFKGYSIAVIFPPSSPSHVDYKTYKIVLNKTIREFLKQRQANHWPRWTKVALFLPLPSNKEELSHVVSVLPLLARKHFYLTGIVPFLFNESVVALFVKDNLEGTFLLGKVSIIHKAFFEAFNLEHLFKLDFEIMKLPYKLPRAFVELLGKRDELLVLDNTYKEDKERETHADMVYEKRVIPVAFYPLLHFIPLWYVRMQQTTLDALLVFARRFDKVWDEKTGVKFSTERAKELYKEVKRGFDYIKEVFKLEHIYFAREKKVYIDQE